MHKLARFGLSCDSPMWWAISPPNVIVNVLLDDMVYIGRQKILSSKKISLFKPVLN